MLGTCDVFVFLSFVKTLDYVIYILQVQVLVEAGDCYQTCCVHVWNCDSGGYIKCFKIY